MLPPTRSELSTDNHELEQSIDIENIRAKSWNISVCSEEIGCNLAQEGQWRTWHQHRGQNMSGCWAFALCAKFWSLDEVLPWSEIIEYQIKEILCMDWICICERKEFLTIEEVGWVYYYSSGWVSHVMWLLIDFPIANYNVSRGWVTTMIDLINSGLVWWMGSCNEKESRERLRDDCHNNCRGCLPLWLKSLTQSSFDCHENKDLIEYLVWITTEISVDLMDTRVTNNNTI